MERRRLAALGDGVPVDLGVRKEVGRHHRRGAAVARAEPPLRIPFEQRPRQAGEVHQLGRLGHLSERGHRRLVGCLEGAERGVGPKRQLAA